MSKELLSLNFEARLCELTAPSCNRLCALLLSIISAIYATRSLRTQVIVNLFEAIHAKGGKKKLDVLGDFKRDVFNRHLTGGKKLDGRAVYAIYRLILPEVRWFSLSPLMYRVCPFVNPPAPSCI